MKRVWQEMHSYRLAMDVKREEFKRLFNDNDGSLHVDDSLEVEKKFGQERRRVSYGPLSRLERTLIESRGYEKDSDRLDRLDVGFEANDRERIKIEVTIITLDSTIDPETTDAFLDIGRG